jgi:hypothetical protein
MTATEVAKAFCLGSLQQETSIGMSTMPPPPPKKPFTKPATLPVMRAVFRQFPAFFFFIKKSLLRLRMPEEGWLYSQDRSFITSPASKNPAMGGTQEALAGTLRRPGGGSSHWGGLMGSSGEKTTL